MDFAADAVLDVVTPQPRPTTARAPSTSDEPSFEDHLHAATQDDAPAEPAPAPTSEHAQSDTEELLGGPEGPPLAAQTPPPEQTASPVLVQLIAAATPAAPQAETQTASGPATPAPVAAPDAASAPTNDAAAPMQAAPTAAAGKSATPADVASDQAVAPSAEKSAPHDKSAAPQQTPTTQVAPTAPQQAATPTTTPAAATTSAATPPVEGATVAPTQTPPAQAQATPDTARQTKTARGDAKTDAADAPVQAASAPAPTAAPRTKSATPQSAPKDAPIVAPLDAPDAAQSQTQPTSSATAAASHSSHTHHAEADQSAVRALPAAQQVAREIVRRFDGGNTRFELRLDPPELGRIEVKLEVSRDHRVTAVIAADSPQALTELVRHSRELEQALQGAGLELTDNGLSFDLRQGSDQNETAEFGDSSFGAAALNEEQTQVAARPLGYERWRGVRVDMMV